MIKYNVVVSCYDKILVNVAAYVIPNQKLYMQPHLPRFYHDNTLPYCILSF